MTFDGLLALPTVTAARSVIRERDSETLKEQIRIAAIPAPTGEEFARGEYVRNRFLELGLTQVKRDSVGNILGRLKSRPNTDVEVQPIVLAAHLDSVFPPGTQVVPRQAGKRIEAPGITDNARGLAAILAVADALRVSGVVTTHPVVFVATVGEEGSGDLRGVKHLFCERSNMRDAAGFISVDGAGIDRVVNTAIGARRIRATAGGPGGHSWNDRGTVNPLQALGYAMVRLRSLTPPTGGTASITVARMGGGTSINAIPSSAWIELDLRSETPFVLDWLEKASREALARGLRDETRVNTGGRLTLEVEVIGDRPCGSTHPQSPLVKAALDASRFLGTYPNLAAASTDANVPISLGIPAIALGAGGLGGGVHTDREWFENERGSRGIERVLLTLLGAAGVHNGNPAQHAETTS